MGYLILDQRANILPFPKSGMNQAADLCWLIVVDFEVTATEVCVTVC